MSGECNKCGEHCLECRCERIKKMAKYKNLSAPTISLCDGIDSPAHRLKQPWEIPCDIPSRKCIECGKLHNMVVTDTVNETHTSIDKCYNCLWKNLTFKPLENQIELQ